MGKLKKESLKESATQQMSILTIASYFIYVIFFTYIWPVHLATKLRIFQGSFWNETNGNANSTEYRNQIIASFLFLLLIGIFIFTSNKNLLLPKRFSVAKMKLDSNRLSLFMGIFYSIWFLKRYIIEGFESANNFWVQLSNGGMTDVTGTVRSFADLMGPVSMLDCAKKLEISATDYFCDDFGRTGNFYPHHLYDALRVLRKVFSLETLPFAAIILFVLTCYYFSRKNLGQVTFLSIVIYSPAFVLGIERANISIIILSISWLTIISLLNTKKIRWRYLRLLAYLILSLLLQESIFWKLYPITGLFAVAVIELLIKKKPSILSLNFVISIIIFIVDRSEFLQVITASSGSHDATYSVGADLNIQVLEKLLIGSSGNWSQTWISSGWIYILATWLVFNLANQFVKLKLTTPQMNHIRQKKNLIPGENKHKNEIYENFIVLFFFATQLISLTAISVQYDYFLILLLPITFSLENLLRISQYRTRLLQVLMGVTLVLLFSRGVYLHTIFFIIYVLILVKLLCHLFFKVIELSSKKEQN